MLANLPENTTRYSGRINLNLILMNLKPFTCWHWTSIILLFSSSKKGKKKRQSPEEQLCVKLQALPASRQERLLTIPSVLNTISKSEMSVTHPHSSDLHDWPAGIVHLFQQFIQDAVFLKKVISVLSGRFCVTYKWCFFSQEEFTEIFQIILQEKPRSK